MSSLRVLFVAPYPPSPLRVRSFRMLQALTARHDVDLVTLAEGHHVESRSLSGRTYSRSGWDLLTSAWRLGDIRLPLQCVQTRCRDLLKAVRVAASTGSYDLLHVEHVRGLQFVAEDIPLPVVFDAVDCLSLLFAKAAQHQGLLMRRVFRHEAMRLARYEGYALRRVGKVLVSSYRDMEALKRIHPGARINVVPNVVDLEAFRPRARRRDQVVFAGRMSYHANRVAAEWLCDEIWPLVRQRHPQARLVIAGPGPGKSLLRRGRNGVDVVGYVQDLAGLVASSAVAVAPLRYAVGTQNKVLEALACATPVVATPAAIEGMCLEPGHDVRVAEQAQTFAEAIGALLGDVGLASSIGIAGRAYVSTNHSVASVGDLLTEHYNSALINR